MEQNEHFEKLMNKMDEAISAIADIRRTIADGGAQAVIDAANFNKLITNPLKGD